MDLQTNDRPGAAATASEPVSKTPTKGFVDVSTDTTAPADPAMEDKTTRAGLCEVELCRDLVAGLHVCQMAAQGNDHLVRVLEGSIDLAEQLGSTMQLLARLGRI